MQISKTFLVCGAALCLIAISAPAADTEADARLREALRQKIAEMNAPQAAPTAPAAPTTPATPVTPPPVVPPVTPAPVAPPVAPAPVVTASVPAPAPNITATVEDDAQTARLREAVRARIAEENSKSAVTVPQTTITQGSDLNPAVSTVKVVAPTPTVAPPLPVPSSKEDRLAQLLRQYKADEITPEQYHQQRAKILAE